MKYFESDFGLVSYVDIERLGWGGRSEHEINTMIGYAWEDKALIDQLTLAQGARYLAELDHPRHVKKLSRQEREEFCARCGEKLVADGWWALCFDSYARRNVWGGDTHEVKADLCESCAKAIMAGFRRAAVERHDDA